MGVHSTVRIPELANLTDGLPLALADKMAIYIASENKTKQVSLQALNTFFATGGGGSHPPVVYGGEMIYIVPSGEAGTDTASITSLAGKDFSLERSGIPMIPLLPDESNGPSGTNEAEFEILDAGGFKLLQSGDVLALNERFKLSIFSLIGGGGGGGGTTAASFITGTKVVTSNLTLDPATEMNKLIQIQGASTAITLTIPDLADIAANSFIPITAAINMSKPTTVNTTGGQNIYFNSTSKTSIVLMPGEIVWLFRDVDGFYIINDFADKYKQLANPFAAYKAELNQLVCKGQLVLRADYPRLWEYIQTLGSSFVSDATWSTASVTVSGRTVLKPYRGCFSSGDGSTNFRLPDLMGMFLRGVKSETGSDSERHLNKPGGYQDATVKVADDLKALKVTGTFTYQTGDSSPLEPNLVTGHDISTGIETRPEDVGYLWLINA